MVPFRLMKITRNHSSRFVLAAVLVWLTMLVGIAQTTLTGTVLTATDRQPVAFASVYLDGTTTGGYTDDAGNFTLEIDRAQLPATLVVSHLNYATWSQELTEPTESLDILLAANPDRELTAVQVSGRDRRAENLAQFRERFLGTDENARRAELRQPERLYFEREYERQTIKNADKIAARHGVNPDLVNPEWSADGTRLSFDADALLRVRGRGPIQIDLPHTGYLLTVSLREFAFNYRTFQSGYLGSFYFQPYEAPGERPRKRHARNRERAYHNS